MYGDLTSLVEVDTISSLGSLAMCFRTCEPQIQ